MSSFWPETDRPLYDLAEDAKAIAKANASMRIRGRALPPLDRVPRLRVVGKFALLRAGMDEVVRTMKRRTHDRLPAAHENSMYRILCDYLRELESGRRRVRLTYTSREPRHNEEEHQVLVEDSVDCLWCADLLVSEDIAKQLDRSIKFSEPRED